MFPFSVAEPGDPALTRRCYHAGGAAVGFADRMAAQSDSRVAGPVLHRISFYSYLLLALCGVIPLIVAFSLMVVHDLFGSPLLTALVCGAGVSAVLVQIAIRWGAFQHMQQRDLRWYRARYPSFVHGRHVRCVYCRKEDVRPRALPHPTHMREHFCGECGQVLYYSPSQQF